MRVVICVILWYVNLLDAFVGSVYSTFNNYADECEQIFNPSRLAGNDAPPRDLTIKFYLCDKTIKL